jgi:hypothetical protein
MRQESLYLPAAIVIGCGLIGAGLYFGLRSSGAPQGPSTQQPPPVVLTSPPADTGGAMAAPPAPTQPSVAMGTGATADVRRRVEQAATAAIEAEKKSKFIPQCWEPAIKKNPDPPRSKHFFSLSFDAEGRENVRGVNDIRGESRGDVSVCLQSLPMGIRITPPPGVPIAVQVPIEFP